MSYGTIRESRRGAAAIIELHSADGLNCYTPEMGEDLVAALRRAAQDREVSGIVLTGAGRIFCAGAHRGVLSGNLGPSGLRIGEEEFIRSFAPEFHNIPKLTIAAFNGSAAGIGVTMSLLCDLRLAVSGAKLRLNFLELGIMPGLGASWSLPACVGPAAAKKLLLCTRQLLSEEALALGLIEEIVPAGELLGRAVELVASVPAEHLAVAGAIKACVHGAMAEAGIEAALEREQQAAKTLRGKR